jgi:Rieske Fe-S protein
MNLSNSADIDRRRFFVTCAAGACAFTASAAGCASLATRPVTAVNGVVRLSLAEHRELMSPLGIVKILPSGERDALFVAALGDDRFAVLSPVCTHRGCTVEAQGEHFVCPCHGSTYDRSGAVLRGPAERPLRRFATRSSGGYLEIDLRPPA